MGAYLLTQKLTLKSAHLNNHQYSNEYDILTYFLQVPEKMLQNIEKTNRVRVKIGENRLSHQLKISRIKQFRVPHH